MSHASTCHPSVPPSPVVTADRRAGGWTTGRLAGMAMLVAAAVVSMFDAWGDIWTFATRNEENTHILLTPLVAGWLFYIRRDALLSHRPRFSYVGPAIIAVAWGMSAYGYYHAVQVLWHLGAVVAVIGAALTFTGIGVVGKALPAFVVLGFLAPIPGAIRSGIALPLQRATATATEVIFDLAGMEVLRMGNLLRYNGQDVAVAEACNGMRMVWALLLVSFVVAFGSPLKPYVRVLILVLSPVAALVCNVIRMTPTVLAYGHWSTSAADLFHDLSGWAMVALAFGLVLGFVQLLRWLGLPVEQGESWDRMLESNPPARGAAA